MQKYHAHPLTEELTVDQWIIKELKRPQTLLTGLIGALVAYIFIVVLFLS